MTKQELKVGILFSLTGTTSISERGQYQASLLAIRHINESGGINGKHLVAVVEDAASDPDVAYQKAKKMIISDQVTAIIGCYTAACRKKLIPILERHNILLFYPTINEGGEQHPNIFYSNSSPNQQLLDFIPWLIQNVGKSFYLLGSDYIYPREINRYIRLLVQSYGGSIYGEQYVALGNQIFDNQISEIRRMNPDILFSTLVGDSTIAYYQQHEKQGLHQVIASNVTAETEIEAIQSYGTTEHYSCFSYFNSINNERNRKFLTEFRRVYGTDTVSSVMESSYNSVFLLAEALKKTDTISTNSIRNALSGLSLEAPQGKIMVDSLNQHLWLNSRIGKVNKHGRFTLVWESKNLIAPIPFWEHALSDKTKDYSHDNHTDDRLKVKTMRHLPFLTRLKKALMWMPYPFAYFNEDDVLLETVHNGSPAILSFLQEWQGNHDRTERLDKTGVGLALKKSSSTYEVTKETGRKFNMSYVVAHYPVHEKKGGRRGVLRVCIPNNSAESIEHILKSIESIVHLCASMAEDDNEKIVLSEALYEITDQLPESLFILKEREIRFQNQMAIKLLERKRDLVNSVLEELSSVHEEELKNTDRIIRREDADESYEIKVRYNSSMYFVYFKAFPRQMNHFSLKDRRNLTTTDLIGTSEPFLKTIELARSASKMMANVLLLGESGTGKELFARAIHNESDRKDKPFVALNCGSISKELIHSELFGYVEGAFTGAKKGGNPGKFESANGGTLFLDEIGEMPLEFQTTLLRVLQEKEVVRVGGHKSIPVDVRIIAATNKDLFQEIAYNGSFRGDLYYRLNVFTIELVPLRERSEDVIELGHYYLTELSSEIGSPKKELSEEAIELLRKCNWPGNIRELSNVIERAFYLAEGSPIIKAEHLPQSIHSPVSGADKTDIVVDSLPAMRNIKEIKQKSNENEREFYIQTLIMNNGNISKTAKYLGISRTTLYRKLEKLHIQTGGA